MRCWARRRVLHARDTRVRERKQAAPASAGWIPHAVAVAAAARMVSACWTTSAELSEHAPASISSCVTLPSALDTAPVTMRALPAPNLRRAALPVPAAGVSIASTIENAAWSAERSWALAMCSDSSVASAFSTSLPPETAAATTKCIEPGSASAPSSCSSRRSDAPTSVLATCASPPSASASRSSALIPRRDAFGSVSSSFCSSACAPSATSPRRSTWYVALHTGWRSPVVWMGAPADTTLSRSATVSPASSSSARFSAAASAATMSTVRHTPAASAAPSLLSASALPLALPLLRLGSALLAARKGTAASWHHLRSTTSAGGALPLPAVPGNSLQCAWRHPLA
mmetsp:Transcript_60441/g.143651  ORF Transcript_60441/g.143651 Transcript_60441/m.143651 type:complete len:343 (-) Transcript_60441:163-1191(-)